MKTHPDLPISMVESEEELSLFLSCLGNEAWRLRQYAIILKPDRFVDDGIDAVPILVRILAKVFHFKILILSIYRLDLEMLGNLVLEQFGGFGQSAPDPFSALAKLMRMSGVIFGEGGRQSIYDPASFRCQGRGTLSRDGFLCLLGALSRERTTVNTAPGIFICLSHQGMAEAQLESIRKLLNNAEHLESCIRDLLGPKHAIQFRKTVCRIQECGMELTIRDDDETVIARGIYDKRTMVHENELPEVEHTLLRPYHPSSLVFELPHEVRATYETTSGRYSGLVEDVISSRDILVSMIHGDEVEECTVLYLNWAFQQLWPVRTLLGQLKRGSAPEVPSILEDCILSLPIGIEITSSTHYADSVGRGIGTALTDVASTAIYYHEHSTGLVKRDLTFQFHPELDHKHISGNHVGEAHNPGSEDGVALIRAAIKTGNMAADTRAVANLSVD